MQVFRYINSKNDYSEAEREKIRASFKEKIALLENEMDKKSLNKLIDNSY